MPAIFTHSENDSSTDEVVAWLQFKGKTPGRFSGNNILDDSFSVKISQKDTVVNYENNTLLTALFKSSNRESIWFRRWANNSKVVRRLYNESLEEDDKVKLSLLTYTYLKDERVCFDDWLISTMTKSHHSLNKHGFDSVNKLELLNLAAAVGLVIPETLITNSRDEALNFLKEKGRIACKSISEGFAYVTKSEQIYMMYTEEVLEENLLELPEKYAITLFQELLDKVFELRVCFLNGEFYSMAILSQGNPNTEIDFRRYDSAHPNRNVPFSIPEKIKQALLKLMDKLDLQSAAIDLVYTSKKEYVFLEVNPVGQFGMVSKPCNYYLEEKIADYLIELER